MKVFASILAIATIASAAATPNMKRQTTSLCGPLDTPQCCTVDVLGVADLDCTAVPNTITTTDDFTSYCAESGTEARCCVLSLLGSDGLLCSGVA